MSDATVFIVDDDQAVARSLRWLIETVRLNVETFASAQGPVVIGIEIQLLLEPDVSYRRHDSPFVFCHFDERRNLFDS